MANKKKQKKKGLSDKDLLVTAIIVIFIFWFIFIFKPLLLDPILMDNQPEYKIEKEVCWNETHSEEIDIESSRSQIIPIHYKNFSDYRILYYTMKWHIEDYLGHEVCMELTNKSWNGFVDFDVNLKKSPKEIFGGEKVHLEKLSCGYEKIIYKDVYKNRQIDVYNLTIIAPELIDPKEVEEVGEKYFDGRNKIYVDNTNNYYRFDMKLYFEEKEVCEMQEVDEIEYSKEDIIYEGDWMWVNFKVNEIIMSNGDVKDYFGWNQARIINSSKDPMDILYVYKNRKEDLTKEWLDNNAECVEGKQQCEGVDFDPPYEKWEYYGCKYTDCTKWKLRDYYISEVRNVNRR